MILAEQWRVWQFGQWKTSQPILQCVLHKHWRVVFYLIYYATILRGGAVLDTVRFAVTLFCVSAFHTILFDVYWFRIVCVVSKLYVITLSCSGTTAIVPETYSTLFTMFCTGKFLSWTFCSDEVCYLGCKACCRRCSLHLHEAGTTLLGLFYKYEKNLFEVFLGWFEGRSKINSFQ